MLFLYRIIGLDAGSLYSFSIASNMNDVDMTKKFKYLIN